MCVRALYFNKNRQNVKYKHSEMYKYNMYKQAPL